MIDVMEVETAVADASGNRIVAKLLAAREQLDMAIRDTESYNKAKRAGRSPAVCESAVTEVVNHTNELRRLVDAALDDMTHKQAFE